VIADHARAGTSRRAFGLAGLALLMSAAVRVAEPAAPKPPTADRLPATEREALRLRRPTQCVLLAIARAGKRMVAAGERGVVIWSDDAGVQWTQAQAPVSVTLTGLVFADDKRGYACGHMGVVLRTDDGGLTWQRVLEGRQAAALVLQAARAAWQAQPAGSSEPLLKLEDAQRLASEGADKPFLHIALRNDGSLVAVGAYGLALTSHDGGRNWASLMHELPNPDGFSLYGYAERGGEQWLFGEQGLLLRADKAVDGTSPRFRSQLAPSPATLFSGLTLADGTLLLAGLRGKLLRSAAPGVAFEAVSTPIDASIFCGVQLARGRVVLAGAAGQLLVWRERAQRFVPVKLPTRFPFAGVAAAPDGALLLVGQRGLLRVEESALRRDPAA
jgi:photosystem II stability/assembly factor-like uncharacterized protein